MELPKRKPTRLNGYDYGLSGAYFITICTANKQKFLSEIVGEGFPLPKLSIFGKIIEKYIKVLSEKYTKISVDNYVIMPNHIHLLLSVTDNDNLYYVDGRGNPAPTLLSLKFYHIFTYFQKFSHTIFNKNYFKY